MKYKKEDFPSLENADEKEFETYRTDDGGVELNSYDGDTEKIFVPYGITEIADYAFKNKEYNPYVEEDENRGSEYLEEVIFPETVKKIGFEAFLDCSYLKRVYIPKSVIKIDETAFCGCGALEDIELEDGNSAYKFIDGCLIDIEGKKLICALKGCKIPDDGRVENLGRYSFSPRDIESVILPNGIKVIEKYAFSGCKSLKDVKLPDRLEVIEDYAFSSCSALTKIALPESLKKIGKNAFAFSGLKEIVLPAALEILGSRAFMGCYLFNLTLAPVKECGSSIVEKCKYLDKVEFLDGWKKIPICILSESGVEEVVLPEGVEEIASSAFKLCHSLKKIKFPHSLTKVCEQAFYASGLEDIEFPPNIKTVEWCAFAFCDGLKKLKIPPRVVENCSDVFYRCERLENVIFEDGVKKIAKNSFACCRNLNSVYIPDSVEEIASYAFGECSSLKEIELPNRTKFKEDTFKNCAVKINELSLMDMTMEEYRNLYKQKIKITRR